ADAGWSLSRHVPEFGRTLGEELLEPTRVYARDCLELVRTVEVHAMAHVTGGGIAANLARVIPDDLAARLDRGTWTPPPVFTVLGELGSVARDDLESTFNLGIGMLAVVPESAVGAALDVLTAREVPAWV